MCDAHGMQIIRDVLKCSSSIFEIFLDDQVVYGLFVLSVNTAIFYRNVSIESLSELYGIICDPFRENQLFSIVYQNVIEFSKVIQ